MNHQLERIILGALGVVIAGGGLWANDERQNLGAANLALELMATEAKLDRQRNQIAVEGVLAGIEQRIAAGMARQEQLVTSGEFGPPCPPAPECVCDCVCQLPHCE